MWAKQDRHPGDRKRLFTAVKEFTGDVPVLYPGSYVDIAPSFLFSSVTYADMDRRAARFFKEGAAVSAIVAENRDSPEPADWSFVHADYSKDLGLEDQSFGLLVSLWSGFVSEHCTRYLQSGGWLLANSSHGDVAMASLNKELTLVAVVNSRSGDYQISKKKLDSYLKPKKPVEITGDTLHQSQRGIAYTKSPFAYIFRRTAATR